MAYYLRKTKRSKGTYLQIYDSYRDYEKKQSRSKYIKTLGYVDYLESLGINNPIEFYEAAIKKMNVKPEQFIKTDKWPETPLKNAFPAILLFTKQVSVNCSSFLYNISHTHQKERILNNDTHPEQQYGRFYS